jgi:iron complex outermembrane receptor protein
MRYCYASLNVLIANSQLTTEDSMPRLTDLTRSAATFALAAALAWPITAQAAEGDQSDYHVNDEDIVVTAMRRTSREDTISGVAIVQAEELAANARPGLGDSLTHTPGVSATSFGPSASRPVLRGLQGERVRVLSNGIGSIDVSNTSVDHAPVVNPLLAQRIEVLRGPQSLLFGSSASGGVVNVIDRRIPDAVPDEPIHFGAMAGYGSAANERMLAASAEVPLGGNWVGHVDGSWLKTDDLRIGGHVLTPELRATALASSLLPPDPMADPEIDFAANAALKGTLPNTANRTWTAGVGLAYVADGGNIGVAYSKYDSLYGVPVRFATEPGQGQEAPRIKLRQDRIDARAEVITGGDLIEKLAFRYAFGDYVHNEIEPDGAIGTTFSSTGMEARFELVQAERGGWKGITGTQYLNRDFNVVGAEAFLPRNSGEQIGFFTLQQWQSGPLMLEGGARYEHSQQVAKPDASQPQFFAGERKFNTFSAAFGAAYDVAPGWKIATNLSRTSRAPAAEELFANGPHAGTSAFEVGDPDLRLEKAWTAEGILRGNVEGLRFEASVFHSWYTNFVYEERTGAIEDGLPEFQVRQANARLYGFEAEAEVTLAKPGPWTISANGLVDYVHADIDGAGPAPRIPPLRMLGGLKAASPHLDLLVEVEHVFAQNRVAAFEASTPGYSLVSLSATWRPLGDDGPLSVILSGNNLFDVNARRHASFLKDYAPLAGRDVRVTLRLDI